MIHATRILRSRSKALKWETLEFSRGALELKWCPSPWLSVTSCFYFISANSSNCKSASEWSSQKKAAFCCSRQQLVFIRLFRRPSEPDWMADLTGHIGIPLKYIFIFKKKKRKEKKAMQELFSFYLTELHSATRDRPRASLTDHGPSEVHL